MNQKHGNHHMQIVRVVVRINTVGIATTTLKLWKLDFVYMFFKHFGLGGGTPMSFYHGPLLSSRQQTWS